MAPPPVDPRPQNWPLSKEFITALRQSNTGRFEAAAALLDQGADINGLYEASYPRRLMGPKVPREQVTALYDAANRADYDAVRFLLDRGADVRARNRTGMAFVFGLFPFENAIDTLCGLDAMRTSKDQRIVLLAEDKFGPETDEDFIRRRDAFDTLKGYYSYNSATLFKPKIEKVIAGEQKRSVAKRSIDLLKRMLVLYAASRSNMGYEDGIKSDIDCANGTLTFRMSEKVQFISLCT